MRTLVAILFTVTVGFTPAVAQSPPESTTQMQLVRSPVFLARLQYLMAQQARVVKAEALATVCHSARSTYATQVLTFPAESASRASVTIVGGVNLIGTVVVTPASAGDPEADPPIESTPASVDSSASDAAAILSQVATFWNALAGCDTRA